MLIKLWLALSRGRDEILFNGGDESGSNLCCWILYFMVYTVYVHVGGGWINGGVQGKFVCGGSTG